MSVAVYPGSFDPITYGHLNLIDRGLRVFDKLIVTVAENVAKKSLFTVEERVDMLQQAVAHLEHVEVDTFQGLLVDYAKKRNAHVVLRGLRAVSDFEFEFQLAHMNRRLSEELETVFMMTGEEHFYVSSQLVREVAGLGGSVDGIVPPHVAEMLRKRLA